MSKIAERLAELARQRAQATTPKRAEELSIPTQDKGKLAIAALKQRLASAERPDTICEPSSEYEEKLAADRFTAARDPNYVSPMVDSTDLPDCGVSGQPTPDTSSLSHTDKYGNVIHYNKEQAEFVTLATTGANCVLIGSAGTGKTTCMQGTIKSLATDNSVPILDTQGHKYLSGGVPGIVVISYTRRAVNNIRKVLPKDIAANCITAHKLLAYAPVRKQVWCNTKMVYITEFTFEPSYTAERPLPSTIHTIIIEEASMLSVELFNEIAVACKHKVRFIFLGDIQQLPPVFGSAILGFAMDKLPTVQLTEVYRQALDSPIIQLAQRILSGKPIEDIANYELPASESSKVTLHPWKKRISPEAAIDVLAVFFKQAYKASSYRPDTDVILIPFVKRDTCSTYELNKHIANFIARDRKAVTHEVIAGFNKYYYSIGDKVLYEKSDAKVVDIQPNPTYTGTDYKVPSDTLDYWGHDPVHNETANIFGGDVDAMLDAVAIEDKVNKCSHIITLQVDGLDYTQQVDTSSEVNAMDHAYCLTVHKSQGSEWRKVFLIFHHSHAAMVARELIYTAVTRAREELYCICEPTTELSKGTFDSGITKQRIPGNSLETKAIHFRGKVQKGIIPLLPVNKSEGEG